MIELVLKIEEFVQAPTKVHVIQEHPADNKFLDCTLEGNADYIVSGDKHLLRVVCFNKTCCFWLEAAVWAMLVARSALCFALTTFVFFCTEKSTLYMVPHQQERKSMQNVAGKRLCHTKSDAEKQAEQKSNPKHNQSCGALETATPK